MDNKKKNPNVPNLRLTNIDYNQYKLKDICSIYIGLTHTPVYVESGVKFISSKNISNDVLDLKDINYISNEEFNIITNSAKPNKGDILFTRVGSNLGHPVIYELDEEICIFVSLGYIRVKEELVKNTYIKHWMNSQNFWNQVKRKTAGAAKINLNNGWMYDFDIKIPSLENQQLISDFISKLDYRISTQNKIIEEYKRLKKSISEALFKNLDSTKTFFKNIYEKAKEGGTPSTNCEAYYDGDIPFIKIDDLNNKYITENKYFISELGLQNSSAWVIPTNSIILSNGATIGSVSINVYPVTTKQGVLGIVPNKNISTEYLYYLINTTDFKRKLKAITTKGTIDCAYIKDIDFIRIKIHDEKNQQKIADILSKIDKKILVESSILNNLINQKKYLLNNLFI